MKTEKCIVIDGDSFLDTDKSGVFYSVKADFIYILRSKEIRGFIDLKTYIFRDVPTYLFECGKTKGKASRSMLVDNNNTVYLGSF